MTSRFDNRTKAVFKKDIKFSTKLEKYWWDSWLNQCEQREDITIKNPRDNGCGNDGEFIAKGNTAGADYMADVQYLWLNTQDLPVEIKWVPTAGKFTLKENDLKSYVKEGACILFIYNSVKCGTDLRKPKNYDFDKHVKLIESKRDQMRWGLMMRASVKELYENAKQEALFKPIHYMGNKLGIILKQEDYSKWFQEEAWI